MTDNRHRRVVLLLIGLLAGLIFHLRWIVPAAFAGDAGGREGDIVIRVRPSSLIDAPRILLGDISDVTADPFIRQAVEDIDLGGSPKPGKIVSIKRQRIMARVKAQRYLPDTVTVTCPETVFVKQQGQVVTGQDIEAYLNKTIEHMFPRHRFELKQLNIRGTESYPKGAVSFAVNTEKLIGKNGRISGYLDVMIDGTRMDRIRISGRVALYDTIVFAARPLSGGRVLARTDFYVKEKNIFEFRETAVRSLDAVAGKILKSSLAKDRSLESTALSEPPLVKKGQVVMLVARYKNLKITTPGLSKEDGFENDTVRAENLHSGRLVRGIVKDNAKVEVLY